jgi:hypothetical protein
MATTACPPCIVIIIIIFNIFQHLKLSSSYTTLKRLCNSAAKKWLPSSAFGFRRNNRWQVLHLNCRPSAGTNSSIKKNVFAALSCYNKSHFWPNFKYIQDQYLPCILFVKPLFFSYI